MRKRSYTSINKLEPKYEDVREELQSNFLFNSSPQNGAFHTSVKTPRTSVRKKHTQRGKLKPHQSIPFR